MERARNMVAIEANLQENPWSISSSTSSIATLWMDTQRRLIATTAPGTDAVAVTFAGNDSDKIHALQSEFEELKQVETHLTKRAQKLEDRTRLVTGGFARRADAALTRLRQLGTDVRNAEIEKACFDRLAQLETRALQSRVVRLANDVNTQQLVEVQLQKQYATLTQ